MSNAVTTTNNQQRSPVVELKSFFGGDSMKAQIKSALPPHIDVERFIRILMTALSQNPKLAEANRDSLIMAAMKCAQDGLLPDGREAALVPFWNNKQKMNFVQYMPMFEGILKKIRNSGEVVTIEAHIVHENDMFTYRPGLDEIPLFNPDWFGDRGNFKGVYAVAKTKDGGIYVEIMSAKQVEAVKNVSRSADEAYSPWNGDFADEMRKKSVIRRLSKRLPKSTDLEQTLRNDDENYELPGKSNANQLASPEAKPALAAPAAQAQADEKTTEPAKPAENKTVADPGKRVSRAEAAMGIGKTAAPAKPAAAPASTTKPAEKIMTPEELRADQMKRASEAAAAKKAVPNMAPGAAKPAAAKPKPAPAPEPEPEYHAPAEEFIEAQFEQANFSGVNYEEDLNTGFEEGDGESPI
jgi:recombination protein RecT